MTNGIGAIADRPGICRERPRDGGFPDKASASERDADNVAADATSGFEKMWLAAIASGSQRLRAYIRRVTRDTADAEDLLAEILQRAWCDSDALIRSASPAQLLLAHARTTCYEIGGASSEHMRGTAADLVNVSKTTSEHLAMAQAAAAAQASYIEPTTGHCLLNCTHADWRWWIAWPTTLNGS